MATICTSFLGEDFVIEFDYRITSPGCEAKLYGPPERCYPADPMEYEIDLVSLRRDLSHPNWDKWADQSAAARSKAMWQEKCAPLDVPEWLRDQIETWLLESDKVYEIIRYDEAA